MENTNTENVNVTEDGFDEINMDNTVGPQVNISQSVDSIDNSSSNSIINSNTSITSTQGINPALVQAFRDTNKILDLPPEENTLLTYKTLNSGLCEVIVKLPKWNSIYIETFIALKVDTVASFIGLYNMVILPNSQYDFQKFRQLLPLRDMKSEQAQDAILFAMTLGGILNSQIRTIHHLMAHDTIPLRDMPATANSTTSFFQKQHVVHQLKTLFSAMYHTIRTPWFNYIDTELFPISMVAGSLASYACSPQLSETPDIQLPPTPSTPSHSDSPQQAHPSTVFMNRIKHQANLIDTSPTKILKRGTLALRITWDGNPTTFDDYEGKLKSHYYQMGCDYIFNDTFLEAYETYGIQCYTQFPDDIPSMAQLQHDSRALYGAIMGSTTSGAVSKLLLKYRLTSDGIKIWIELCKQQKSNGSREVQIDRLEKIIHTAYTNHYKGGLLQYITDYDNAFAKLEYLGVHDYANDSSKKRKLLKNVASTLQIPEAILMRMSQHDTFDEFCNLLRQHHLLAKPTTHNQVHQTIQHPATPTTVQKVTSTSNIQDDHTSQHAAALIQQMPMDMWEALPSDTKQWLIKERKRLNQQAKTEKGSKLPNQYSKVNQTITQEQLDQSVTQFLEDLDEDSEPDTSTENTHQVTNIQTIVHTSLSQAKISKCLNLLKLDAKDNIAITDDGADTSVIGQGWSIISQDPFCKATVVGFDHQAAQKTGLPIVTAVTAVDLPNNTIVLVQIGEAIYNSRAQHSLLSEFQMREHGVTVNSIAHRH